MTPKHDGQDNVVPIRNPFEPKHTQEQVTQVHPMKDAFEYFKEHGELPDDELFTDDPYGKDKIILELYGVSKETIKQPYINSETDQAAQHFFDELVEVAHEARRDPDLQEVTKKFVAHVHSVLLSHSPNIFNYHRFNSMAGQIARLRDIPELEPITENAAGEMVYTLAFAEPSFRKEFLKGFVSEGDPITRLQRLRLIRYMASSAQNAGYETAEDLFHSLQECLSTVQKDIEGQSPFVREAAFAHGKVLSHIHDIHGENGPVFVGRAVESVFAEARQESNQLMHQNDVAEESPRPRAMMRVARDVVAGCDGGYLLPYMLAPSDKQDKNSKKDLSFVYLEDYEGLTNFSGAKGADRIQLLKSLHDPMVRKTLEMDLGINIRELSLAEQLAFTEFLVRASDEQYQRAKKLMRDRGTDAARVFLSCDYGEYDGKAILDIAEKLPEEAVDAVLNKYLQIVDAIEATSAEDMPMAANLVNKIQVQKELLRRGKEVIAEYARSVNANEVITTEEIVRRLEGVRENTLLLAAMFKTAFKGREKDVKFSEIKGLSLESFDPAELDVLAREKKFEQFKEMLLTNWATKGADAAALALHGLEEGFENKKAATRFYELGSNGEAVGFIRFDERPDLGSDVLYAGSFNVSPSLKGSAIGSALFHETLKKEGETRRIVAHVLKGDPLVAVYQNEFGFSIVGEEVETATDGTKTVWLNIERPKSREELRIAA